jgi:glycolate oxidase iron-sulfur subunit
LLPSLVPQLKPLIQPEALQAAGLQAYHPPCTLQHGQQLNGGVETHLGDLGLEIKVTANESDLCCGSAGTYSVLNPDLSKQLRDRKLSHLNALQPQGVISANIGCITHLQSGSGLPVQHWVELVDAALVTPAS